MSCFEDPATPSASRTAAGLLQLAGGRLSRRHLELRRACREFYPPFLTALGALDLLRRQGHLRCDDDEAHRTAFLATLRGLGIQGRQHSHESLWHLTSGGVAAPGAVWLPDWAICPDRLLQRLERSLETFNVRCCRSAVASVRSDGLLDAAGEHHRADVVVLACGAGLNGFSSLPWRFTHQPGWGASYPGTLPLDHSLEGCGQTLVPCSDSWRLAGDQAWEGAPPLAKFVALPGEPRPQRRAERCNAPDGLPVAGALAPGRFMLGGLGRNGLLTAPLLAHGLAELITTGSGPSWLDRFSLQRAGIADKRSWAR